jgi:hypothetical protein
MEWVSNPEGTLRMHGSCCTETEGETEQQDQHSGTQQIDGPGDLTRSCGQE